MEDVMRLIRKFIRPYQDFILPIVLLVASIVVVFVGIIPGVGKTYEVWGQLSTERTEVTNLRTKAQFLASLDETTLFNDLSTLTAAIPVDKSIPTILATVDGVSAKTGSVFSSFQLSAPGSLATEAAKRQTTEEAALGSYIIPFTLNMEGPYAKLRDTLDALTTSRRLMRIKNFTIGFQGDTGRALINMDTLYALLPKPVAGKTLVPLTTAENTILSTVGNLPLLSKTTVFTAPSSGPRLDPFSP